MEEFPLTFLMILLLYVGKRHSLRYMEGRSDLLVGALLYCDASMSEVSSILVLTRIIAVSVYIIFLPRLTNYCIIY